MKTRKIKQKPWRWAANCENRCPLKAIQDGRLDVTDTLGRTPLHWAAKYRRLQKVPVEHLTPANLSVPDKEYGMTPLHWVTRRGQLNVVPTTGLTVENLTTTDSWGNSPLLWAWTFGQLDYLLGIELPEKVRAIVGNEWFDKNLLFIKSIVTAKNTVIAVERDCPLIELF